MIATIENDFPTIFRDADDAWILIQYHKFGDLTAFDERTWDEYKNGFSQGHT